jgi:hypothetical protein
MGRIITNNYRTKLKSLFDNYQICPDLSSLVKFFSGEVQKDQNGIGNRNQKVFSKSDIERFNEIKNSDKIRLLFAYINIIIKEFPQQYLHIHINKDLSDSLIENLTSLMAWEVFVSSSYNEVSLENEVNSLELELKRELNLTGVSGHSENKLRRERKGWRHKLRLIKQIMRLESSCTKNGVLLNLNAGASKFVNLSEYSIFPESLNTYVNFGDNLRNIFIKMGQDKVLRLSMILNLFPSTTGKSIWYKDFNRDQVHRYNNFKKVITITSGEKTLEALLEMQKQNKFQADEIYTIFSFEI